MNKIKINGILLIILMGASFSCKKYLDEKPDKKLVTPTRLVDMQAILDDVPNTMITIAGGEGSADDYYLTSAELNVITPDGLRRLYVWEKDNFFGDQNSDWGQIYRRIYYANTVLEALKDVPQQSAERDNIEGQALFIRGSSFLETANVWSLPYDSLTAATDPGIPLRLNADFNELSTRASVSKTFEQLTSDLKRSVPLLPVVVPHPVRASRSAAYAYLSRVYMAMRRYHEARLYADSCLQLSNTLINYNTLDSNATRPFRIGNAETIFVTVTGSQLVDRGRIDTMLVRSYASNDLRRAIFFKKNADGSSNFKGSYSGSNNLFSGIAVDEILLTRAECYAIEGNTTAAMADLNTLLIKRFKTGTFVPYSASGPAVALALIREERHKELVMRFLRWADIRRYNKEGAGIVLKRNVNGQQYTLPPNSIRYALPLPEYVIALSGMPQNPR